MLASGSDFPRDDLMNCLRSGGKGREEFIKQAKKLNIQWIYEIIKYSCNALFQAKEMPDTKLTSLILIKDLFQTCQVPCVHLIEVYVLPIIYEFAIYKPQQKQEKRGNFFFQNNGYSARISNIEQTGMKFINLCTEIVYFGSLVKKKRTFENEQLKQPSQFIEYFEKFKKYGIEGTPISPKQLKYFSEKTAKNANEKYLKNLKEFQKYSDDYSEYFVIKMVQSLQTEQNVLFSSAGKTVSSINNDLDMRKILKYGDTYITSPLLQELTQGMKTAENFLIKRNFLSLLSDFVKWADIESFIQICYDDALDQIAPRIAEINGDKGLNEGEFIYPEIKGQRQSKKKFYIQFLKSLEIWSKCIKGDLEDEEEQSKVEQLYEFLKIERKFIFPQNLMSKRIQSDFLKCQQFNAERNQKILSRLRNDKTSIVNKKKSTSINKATLAKSSMLAKEKVKKITFEQINNQFEECFQNFITLADEEDQLAQKMKRLKHFKQNFDNDLENVQEDGRPFDEFEDLLDNGDDLIENIQAVEDLYKDYKSNKITFKKFQEQFEQILENMEDMDEEEEQQQEQSSNINSSNNRSSNHDVSLSISKSRKSIKKRLSDKNASSPTVNNIDNYQKSPQIETPKLKKLTPKGEEKTSTLSRKIKNKRESQIKKSNIKSSIRQKKSSMVVSNIPNQSAIPQSQVEQQKKIEKEYDHPYYNQNQALVRVSKLSKLENKSIHSKKSGLGSKIRKRRSQLSQQSSRNGYKASYAEQQRSNLVGENDYMIKNLDSQKKSFRQMVQSHRSSRMSGDTSRVSSSFHRSIRRYQKDKPDNVVHYQKRQSVVQQDQITNFQVLTEQINQGDGSVAVKTLGRKNSKAIQKNIPDSPQKVNVSSFSRKSLIRDKNKKVSSILKMSRKSSRSGLSSNSRMSSEAERVNRQNKSRYPVVANTDDYMIQPSKAEPIHKSNHYSHISSKRPMSSHSKRKLQNSKLKVFQQDRQQYQRPQTSSNHQFQRIEQLNDHYQIRRAVNEGDKIKQPEIKPMQNSYYGIEQIEAKVKNTSKMEFKQCFQVEKEVIQVGNKKQSQFIQGIHDPVMNKKGKSTNQSSSLQDMNVNKNPQEEYLMMKLRKQHEQEQNDQLKKLQGRILKLKTQTSKIRNDLTSRSQDNKEFSLSRRSHSGASSREFCSFSSSKNSRNSSYHSISKQKINTSRVQSITVEGRLLNTKSYEHHYNEIKDENIKKTFLRSKAILLKNQYIQLGSIFRRERNNLKILMYLTPNVDISNLNISISRQYNMEIKVFPEVFPEIPKSKQVRITLEVQLKSAPFSMPSMYVNFIKGGRQQKSYTVFLPCSLHRFVEFHSIADRQQFLKKFEGVGENIVKTVQFRVSRRVAKIDHIQQYFPKMTTVLLNGDTHKYAAECTFKRQRFLLLLTTRKPQNMVIQGIPLTRPQFLQYFLSFLKHIFTMDQ